VIKQKIRLLLARKIREEIEQKAAGRRSRNHKERGSVSRADADQLAKIAA
jgi:hypothetical protein